jgi:hypothetical protein
MRWKGWWGCDSFRCKYFFNVRRKSEERNETRQIGIQSRERKKISIFETTNGLYILEA